MSEPRDPDTGIKPSEDRDRDNDILRESQDFLREFNGDIMPFAQTPGQPAGQGPDLLDDAYFMRAALRCARQAAEADEVPVGAVAVKDGLIIARSWNQVELLNDATAHAELLLISSLPQIIGDWRLDGIDIYVTKEPCAMCAGAMVNSRVRRVIYGMPDPRSGCAGSAIDITGFPGMLHRVEVTGGVLQDDCLAVFRSFFRRVRSR